jgi:hypothetical protein
VFASLLLKYESEKVKNLDLEVLTDALSFKIKNREVKNFQSMALLANVRFSHGPSLKEAEKA